MRSFDVKIISEGSIIQTTHYGVVTFVLATASRKKAGEMALQHGIHNFLIDLSQAKVVGSVLEFYHFHSRDPDVLPYPTRMALVYDIENLDGGSENEQFSENLDINRGIERRAFKEKNNAIAWLLKEKNRF